MMTLMDSTLLVDVEGLSSLFTVIASLDGKDLSVSLSLCLLPFCCPMASDNPFLVPCDTMYKAGRLSGTALWSGVI